MNYPKYVKFDNNNWYLSKKIPGKIFYYRGPNNDLIYRHYYHKVCLIMDLCAIGYSVWAFSPFAAAGCAVLWTGIAIHDYKNIPDISLHKYEQCAIESRCKITQNGKIESQDDLEFLSICEYNDLSMSWDKLTVDNDAIPCYIGREIERLHILSNSIFHRI
jgi:hypothetical protein